MISNYVGGTSQGAFQTTYDYIFIKMGACSECDGGGAYTHGAHSIEFHSGSPFFKPTEYRSSGLAFEMNVHTVVHELGHAFAHIGSWYESKGALHYRPNSPYVSSFPESWYLTDDGFAQGPNYINPWMWRQRPDQGEGHEDNTTRSHEAFADMFLGFTYGVWANNDRGSARRDYMTANMAEWIP